MPKLERHKTKYPGVSFIEGKGSQKPERIYYIRYRRQGKMIEEKAGRQYQDDMTPAKAAHIRTMRIRNDQPSNKEQREAVIAEQKAQDGRWTIDKLWKAYKEGKSNFKGIVQDQNRYENYIKLNFGDKEPKELIPLDIDRLRINLLKEKKPGSVKNILELLRRIVNFGQKKNLCNGLTFIIEMPKVNNIKTEDLTANQLSKLMIALDEESDNVAASLMKMALFTGMRRGELFKLKWANIDFDKNLIHIVDPKGGSDQMIPLNNEARNLLENYTRGESEFVFPGRGGKQRTDIKRQVNKIKEKAGLPKDFRALHGLRHVYASMLASSGKVWTAPLGLDRLG